MEIDQKKGSPGTCLRGTPKRRLRVLISAYACCPNHGSEPEVGWSFSKAMAEYNDVWVLTRAANRQRIQAELDRDPVSGLNFVYYDLPAVGYRPLCGGLLLQLHYYIWQVAAICKVRQKQAEIGFDISHHVTFAKYWAPSCLAWLGIPFIWGPVGGAEHTPTSLLSELGWSGRAADFVKRGAAGIGELDPFVKKTARQAALAFASTQATAARLRRMGAGRVGVETQIGINPAAPVLREAGSMRGCRFVSIGRMIPWKGFLLGLKAFAGSGLKDGEYLFIGDGPCRSMLEKFADEHALTGQVRFLGNISREDVLKELSRSDVLVHPSFHDSAGLVCLEAMALGCPVICLNVGGPGWLVGEESGIRIPVEAPSSAIIRELSAAMFKLATHNKLRRAMGEAARVRASGFFLWAEKAERMARCYAEVFDQEMAD
jgi:glycosyltransferase involved in cell wall biosynthesis